MKNVITFNCPNCGTEFTISESANKTSQSKSQQRLVALKMAGFDVSNIFAMTSADGSEYIARVSDGHLSVVTDDDPIIVAITKNGTVPNRKLFRRWVMAQMFHLLTRKDYGANKPMGFNEAVRRMGYEYQWKMTDNELKVQARLDGSDQKEFADRNRWFNKGVIYIMCKEYIEELQKHIKVLREKKCKGVPYKTIAGRDIFVSDIHSKIFVPLYRALTKINNARDAKELYSAFHSFNNLRVRLKWNTELSRKWLDAYKGSGAFYTMKNLVMFHGCRFVDDNGNRQSTERLSINYLYRKANTYENEGWRMLGVMKKLIDDNGIDIEKKMASWKK